MAKEATIEEIHDMKLIEKGRASALADVEKLINKLQFHNGWEDYGDNSPMGFLGDCIEVDKLKQSLKQLNNPQVQNCNNGLSEQGIRARKTELSTKPVDAQSEQEFGNNVVSPASDKGCGKIVKKIQGYDKLWLMCGETDFEDKLILCDSCQAKEKK